MLNKTVSDKAYHNYKLDPTASKIVHKIKVHITCLTKLFQTRPITIINLKYISDHWLSVSILLWTFV